MLGSGRQVVRWAKLTIDFISWWNGLVEAFVRSDSERHGCCGGQSFDSLLSRKYIFDCLNNFPNWKAGHSTGCGNNFFTTFFSCKWFASPMFFFQWRSRTDVCDHWDWHSNAWYIARQHVFLSVYFLFSPLFYFCLYLNSVLSLSFSSVYVVPTFIYLNNDFHSNNSMILYKNIWNGTAYGIESLRTSQNLKLKGE